MTERLIHSRGYLPHVNGADFQFITYRLGDSLPNHVIDSMSFFDGQKKQQINHYLDQGMGGCLLNDSANAQIVIDNWLHFEGERYEIMAYVVMPNHVHILIRVIHPHELSQIVQSWKSYTAKKISNYLSQNIWFRDYFDRYIRDQNHFDRTVDYIRQNPVQAGLVKQPEQWPFLFVNENWMNP